MDRSEIDQNRYIQLSKMMRFIGQPRNISISFNIECYEMILDGIKCELTYKTTTPPRYWYEETKV